jgi:tetratricopeptide (TPR) repeat protein
MFYSNCGKKIGDAAKFYSGCGTPVKVAPAPRATKPAPAQKRGYEELETPYSDMKKNQEDEKAAFAAKKAINLDTAEDLIKELIEELEELIEDEDHEEDMAREIDDDEDSINACYVRASQFLSKKEYDNAIHEYTQFIRKNPPLAYAHLTRGKIYVQANSFQEGLNDFSKAIEINPKFSDDAYFERGKLWCQFEEYANAKKDFARSIKINSSLKISINKFIAEWKKLHQKAKINYM